MSTSIALGDELLHEALAVPRGLGAPPDLVDAVMHQVATTPPRDRRWAGANPLPLNRAVATLMAAAVLGALLATLLVLLTIGSRTPMTGCAPWSSSASPEIPGGLPEAGRYVGTIPREPGQEILGVDGDQLWLASSDSVARLDTNGGPDGQGVVAPSISIPTQDTGIPPSPGGWWIATPRPNSLVQFFPDTGTFGPRIHVDLVPYRVAADDDALFITDFEAGRLLKADPATGSTLVERELPQAAAIAISADGTVVVSSRDGELLWLDPDTLATLGDGRVAGAVMSFVPDGDRLIIQRNSRGQLTWFDPLEVGSEEHGRGARATALALGPGAIWASEWAQDSIPAPLLRLDPTTLLPIARSRPPARSAAESLAVVGDQLWSGGVDGTSGAPVLYRIEPNPCIAT
jgi:hypothetical protein